MSRVFFSLSLGKRVVHGFFWVRGGSLPETDPAVAPFLHPSPGGPRTVRGPCRGGRATSGPDAPVDDYLRLF